MMAILSGQLIPKQAQDGSWYLESTLSGYTIRVYENKFRRNDKDPSHVWYLSGGNLSASAKGGYLDSKMQGSLDGSLGSLLIHVDNFKGPWAWTLSPKPKKDAQKAPQAQSTFSPRNHAPPGLTPRGPAIAQSQAPYTAPSHYDGSVNKSPAFVDHTKGGDSAPPGQWDPDDDGGLPF